jgi:hypothetical protein
VPQTINSANYVYFLAYKELFALRARGEKDERLDEIVNGSSSPYPLERYLMISYRGILKPASWSRTGDVLER